MHAHTQTYTHTCTHTQAHTRSPPPPPPPPLPPLPHPFVSFCLYFTLQELTTSHKCPLLLRPPIYQTVNVVVPEARISFPPSILLVSEQSNSWLQLPSIVSLEITLSIKTRKIRREALKHTHTHTHKHKHSHTHTRVHTHTHTQTQTLTHTHTHTCTHTHTHTRRKQTNPANAKWWEWQNSDSSQHHNSSPTVSTYCVPVREKALPPKVKVMTGREGILLQSTVYCQHRERANVQMIHTGTTCRTSLQSST